MLRLRRRRLPCVLVALAFAAPGTASAAAEPLPALRTGPLPAAERPDPAELLAPAVRGARRRVGAPYAMGASGPGAFDCSGLMIDAFRRVGRSLPHSSFAQFALGVPVPRDAIRAGDLVFFDTNGPGASHVGIATGRATVISATSSGVMQHPTDDAYWGAAYVGARRLTPEG